jgi:hypothetical protein
MCGKERQKVRSFPTPAPWHMLERTLCMRAIYTQMVDNHVKTSLFEAVRLYQARHLKEGLMATTRLLASRSNSTGAQRACSPALGVIRFSTKLIAVTATTHTSQRETRDHPGRISPARDNTIAAIPTISVTVHSWSKRV